jgi:hypothetical protein
MACLFDKFDKSAYFWLLILSSAMVLPKLFVSWLICVEFANYVHEKKEVQHVCNIKRF